MDKSKTLKELRGSVAASGTGDIGIEREVAKRAVGRLSDMHGIISPEAGESWSAESRTEMNIPKITVRIDRKLADEAMRILGVKDRTAAVHAALRVTVALNSENYVGSSFEKVLSRALEVFKSNGKANHWLKTPCFALGGQIPTDLIESEEGLVIVLDELGRIEHGIFI